MISLTAATLAAVLGVSGVLLTATTDAQARVRVTVFPRNTPAFWAARVKYCNDQTQGLYRLMPNDLFVQSYGYCLSDIIPWAWDKSWTYGGYGYGGYGYGGYRY
jgi:hypothetical protein